VQTNVEVAWPVNGDGVLALEYFNELACMFLHNEVYANIVDH
jgi:hypothetical protein